MKHLLTLIAGLARRRHVELPPDWAAPAAALGLTDRDPDVLLQVCQALDWQPPVHLKKAPKPQEFPLLVRHPLQGWALAEQWQNDTTIRTATLSGPEYWSTADTGLEFWNLVLPGENLRKEDSRSLRIFVNALLARRRMIVEAAVATAMLSLIGLAVSLFSMQVYDRVIPQGGVATLWVMLFGVLCALSLEFVLRWLRSVSLERDAVEIDSEVSAQFFARLQGLRLDARPPTIGTLAAQMRGLEQVRAVMSSASLFFIADLPFALFFVWVVYLLGGPIVLIPLLALPVVLAMGWLVARALRRETKRTQTGGYRKNGLLVDAIGASETIKAVRGHWNVLAQWNTLVESINADDERIRRWTALSQSAAAAVQQLVYVSMIAWGSLAVIRGDITMGALIACSIISGRVTGPLLTQLPGLILQWSYARTALEGLDQLLKLPQDREPDGDYQRPATLEGRFSVESLAFEYQNAKVGISVPALTVVPGERVAIIGPVGSGKSTVLKSLAGLFRAQTGSVRLAGLDIHQIAEDVLRAQLGYLPQDYRLIQGTLRYNLLLGMADPGDEALMAAAAQTGLSQIISAHPKGLDLPISEGGGGVSGGQRQLIGLTRLLLAKPRAWLLDEPTASLDQDSEARILSVLDKAAGPEGTMIFVTHKPALLQLAKRVIVVVGGKVVLDGPTNQVLERLRKPLGNPPSDRPAASAVAAV